MIYLRDIQHTVNKGGKLQSEDKFQELSIIFTLKGRLKLIFLENFHFTHCQIPFQDLKGQNWYHFLTSEVYYTLSKLYETSIAFYALDLGS